MCNVSFETVIWFRFSTELLSRPSSSSSFNITSVCLDIVFNISTDFFFYLRDNISDEWHVFCFDCTYNKSFKTLNHCLLRFKKEIHYYYSVTMKPKRINIWNKLLAIFVPLYIIIFDGCLISRTCVNQDKWFQRYRNQKLDLKRIRPSKPRACPNEQFYQLRF